jgi:hypothetical protein
MMGALCFYVTIAARSTVYFLLRLVGANCRSISLVFEKPVLAVQLCCRVWETGPLSFLPSYRGGNMLVLSRNQYALMLATTLAPPPPFPAHRGTACTSAWLGTQKLNIRSPYYVTAAGLAIRQSGFSTM